MTISLPKMQKKFDYHQSSATRMPQWWERPVAAKKHGYCRQVIQSLRKQPPQTSYFIDTWLNVAEVRW